ncbi:hypothetical protein J7L05_12165 [bacterium]|nr:hypothetical protein [bacterium]
MYRSLRFATLMLILFIMAVHIGCMGAPPGKTVVKFLTRCQSGDWAGAESMLSESGRLYFSQRESLEEMFWPMLGMAGKAGIPLDTIKEKMKTAIIIISDDTSSTTRGSVRVKINNSLIIGKDAAKSIASSVGLDSIDIIIKINLVQESNRWKIEMISQPGMTDDEKARWGNLAKKSPTSLGI